MIGIGTKLFDLNGNFVFYDKDMFIDDLTNSNVSRRISKVKTLDGGVHIDDSGYAPGDIDMVVTVMQPSKALYMKLMDLFIYHEFVYLATSTGNFLCVPSLIKLKSGNAVMTFSTKSNA